MALLAVDEVALREPRLLVPGMQPLGRVILNRKDVTRGNSWVVCGSQGIKDLSSNSDSMPATKATAKNYSGIGWSFTASGNGVTPTVPFTIGSTNSISFFAVVYPTAGAAWSGVIYDRNGMNGIALGNTGLAMRYVWDGSEWSYNTGLTMTLNKANAIGMTILPDRAITFVNGSINVRYVANSARTWGAATGWLGMDPQGADRTFVGHILLAGITKQPMLEAEAASWSADPYQFLIPA